MGFYEIAMLMAAGISVLLVLYGIWDSVVERRDRRRTPLHSQENADDKTTKLEFPELRQAPAPRMLDRGDGARAQPLQVPPSDSAPKPSGGEI